jgi:hypothetical protein
MSIDTTAPRSRRALLFGALGGAVASVAAFARPATTRAGSDGDVVLDDTNTGSGTTEILAAGSNPAFKVTGGGVGIQAAGGIGIDAAGDPALSAISAATSGVGAVGWSQGQGAGVLGFSSDGVIASPTPSAKTGVHGLSDAADAAAIGVLGHATSGVGVAAVAGAGTALTADAAAGHAIRGTSTASHGIRGRGQLDGVIGESPGSRSGIVGYSGGGSAPAGPGKTGVYGEATQDTASRGVSGYTLAGQGVRGEATSGQGVQAIATTGNALKADATTGLAILATSSLGTAVRGHGQVDGIVGESPANSGIVGYSGPGPTPAGALKVGVYGEAHQSSSAAGVAGRTSIGQGVRGQADSGIGVRAISATGDALNVSGKVKLDRSGRASVLQNKDYVDVTVPGGVVSTALAFATLQTKRTGVYVAAVRPAYPSASTMRIYLNKVASTTTSTPVAWMVLS